ncbi:MAG: PhzF family phenazine biosynthesis protein [Paracoccaceae bacterium]
MARYLVYDVFTDSPFGGNQLAVFPDASSLAEDRLQDIAREFNFSETTFVLPPRDPAHTALVRIFTPTMEVPFAGHPIIGTACALADAGLGPEMVLELGVGPLPCHAAAGRARFTTSAPLEILDHPDPALVAAALGLDPAQLCRERHAPAMASIGLPFTLTELAGPEALAACQPDIAAFRRGAGSHPGGLDFAQYAYIRDGDRIEARMFAPLDMIPEDAATGSAAATLGAYLCALEGRALELTIRQGVAMGRPSQIAVSAREGAVTVAGAAVRVMEGRLLI